ncbi:MAG: hemerythrin domain-containing protein [Gemmatimonadales bacterium]
MKATKILMDEHRVIERVLDALERAAAAADDGEEIRPSFFLEAAEFIQGFADGCHHQKEEEVLFKAMTAAGVPVEAGPIAVMLQEHEQGRAYNRAMRRGAERWQGGDEGGRSEVVSAVRGYVALLRQHIQKEDQVLFPLAEDVIPASEHAHVTAQVERVELEEERSGAHERFLALAEKLAAEQS